MKNLIKSKFLDARRLGSSRSTSMSSNEDGSNNVKQPVQQHQQQRERSSKKYSRRQQQEEQLQQQQHRRQRSQQRDQSESPHYHHQHHHQQSPRDSNSGVRDLFQFSTGMQPPQMPIQQPRQQAIFRTTGTSYGAPQQQQQSNVYNTNHYDERLVQQQQIQQRLISYPQQQHNHYESQQQPQSRQLHSHAHSTRGQYANPFVPPQHEQEHRQHYQRDFAPMGLAQSTSPLSFSAPALSPENNHIRPHQQHQNQFEFGSNGDNNVFSPDEDNCRVRFSSSSSVSSSFSEDPSQVHMMAGGGQSVASSSCMSGGSSYLFESASKRNSKGDLAIFNKVVRGDMHDENERLCAMGMMSINQDGTTTSSASRSSGRTSPEQQWTTPTSLPRMRNEEVPEVGIESEYHDVDDEEFHPSFASPLSASSAGAGAAASNRGSPSNDRRGNQNRSDENDFAMTGISEWSSSCFR